MLQGTSSAVMRALSLSVPLSLEAYPRNFVRRLLVRLSVVVAVALMVAVGSAEFHSQAVAASSKTKSQVKLFENVLKAVRKNYVDTPDDKGLIEGALRGMLLSLDPHSSYLSDREYQAMLDQLRGEFAGVGLDFTSKDGELTVISPIEGSPAAKAGLRPNDVIREIDDNPAAGLSVDQAVLKLRGPAGTSVKLTIDRPGLVEPFAVTLTRAEIVVNPVKVRAEGDVGYVSISSFDERTAEKLEKAFKRLRSEMGSPIKGYVLDLRNDPGGLLEEAIAVADDFLDRGTIVSTKGRSAQSALRFVATRGDIANGLPMIVLINGGTASAAEIVAGALQDNGRARTVGTRSFGKGSVQSIIELGGDGGAIQLTVARYYTPSGRSIQARGIEPDIVVENTEEDASQPITEAESEASLPGHLKNPAARGSEDEAVKGSSNYVPKDREKDAQLQRALKLLRDPSFAASSPPRGEKRSMAR